MTNRPNIARSSATAALSALAGWMLLNLVNGLSHPTSADPSAVTAWWADVGTPSAAALIAGSVGVIIGGYLTVVGVLGVSIGFAELVGRLPVLESIWTGVSTESLRRILAVGLITVYASAPSLASAAVDQPPSIVLVDLGPAEEAPPLSVSPPALAPDDDVAPADAGDTSPADGDTWIVAPGDHLWHIAERVLQSGEASPSIRSVTKYWRRLIAENRSTIGSNPDLIFPGQILRLPTPIRL